MLFTLIFVSSLFIGCSEEQTSLEISDDASLTLVPPIIDDCFFNRLITVEYDDGLNQIGIQVTRNEYMGRISTCDYVLMSPLQPTDPYLDSWAIYACGCTPDGDSDDLDTTIDSDPRLDQRENVGG